MTSDSEKMEDEEAVDKILNCKSHFELLEIPLDAPADVVKKQYKKIALSVHPDKNASPRADEAFKLLRAAFECLSDTLKRSDYLRTLQGSSSFSKKRAHVPVYEPEEERKKRREQEKEEEKLRREAEAEKRREWAEAYCEASSERMDTARQSWKNFQQKKKKR